jgi:hypothetical protein
VPIGEAARRWTPTELWRRYEKVADHYGPVLVIPLSGMTPVQKEARRLHSEIAQILIGKLVGGELIASGLALPLKETSRRRDIRPELWPQLYLGW